MQIDQLNKLIEDEPITGEPTELPLYFEGKGEVKGFSFRQFKYSDRAYIYEVSDTSGKKWYEVFAKKKHTRFDIIAYPRSNAFGVWAWTTPYLEKANLYFDQLNAKKLKHKNGKTLKQREDSDSEKKTGVDPCTTFSNLASKMKHLQKGSSPQCL